MLTEGDSEEVVVEKTETLSKGKPLLEISVLKGGADHPFCVVSNSPNWIEMGSKKLAMNAHWASRILNEIIIPEASYERPPFENPVAPPLPSVESFNCEKNGFLQKRKESKEKTLVVDAILFGLELDMLEVRILELDAVVDYFVILEEGCTHSGLEKKLSFSMDRFKNFEHKIKYFSLDKQQMDVLRKTIEGKKNIGAGGTDWRIENNSRLFLLQKVRELFPDVKNGFVISGDLDEIPNRLAIFAARHCHWKYVEHPVMCTRTRHYQYSLYGVFAGDYPPKGHDSTVRQFPVLVPFSNFTAVSKLVDIIRPYQPQLKCEGPVGVHYSWFNGLARIIFKMLATVETDLVYGGGYQKLVVRFVRAALHIDTFHQELNTTQRGFHPQWAPRISRLKKLGTEYIPWPIQQNPQRYASFYGIYPSCGTKPGKWPF